MDSLEVEHLEMVNVMSKNPSSQHYGSILNSINLSYQSGYVSPKPCVCRGLSTVNGTSISQPGIADPKKFLVRQVIPYNNSLRAPCS